ncbi:MAG: OmpA family protein [Mariprofundus sp.]|nr:OmpA family protein [Mariprofundus sp.]
MRPNNMLMLRTCSILCLLLVLVSSCAPSHKPLSKEDKQIIAVMMVIGAGIGAGVGAAASTVSSDSAGLAVAGALAGAASGYVVGNLVVEHMNQQEKEIRLSAVGKNGDVYVERIKPDVLKITLEHGAEFPVGSSELSLQGSRALDDVARAVQKHGQSTVTIVAYANDAASSRANTILSENRAIAVADYLHQHGVGDSAISAKGKGRPVLLPASKITQKNPYFRRIEITVKGQPV